MTTHAYRPLSSVALDARDGDRYCLGCGYNLRGLREGRCPECGRAFDPHEHCGVRAPWAQRRQVGAFDAFWRTVALVTFRPGEFADRFDWPRVRFHGSHRFRVLTVAHATAAASLAAAAIACYFGATAAQTAVVLGAMVPSAACLFYGATELGSYFTGPRMPSDSSEEVFRARMVGDYASAALAWTPLPALLVAAGAAARAAGVPADRLCFVLAVTLAAWVGVLWFGDVMVLFTKALSLGRPVVVLTALFFPLRFAGVALLTTLFVFAPIACCVGGLISLRR